MIEIRALREGDDRTQFQSGDPDLDTSDGQREEEDADSVEDEDGHGGTRLREAPRQLHGGGPGDLEHDPDYSDGGFEAIENVLDGHRTGRIGHTQAKPGLESRSPQR